MVGNIKTHYVHQGEKGRPIVLIHGFGSNTYSWRKNVPVLAKDYRVYALDLKGFGLTEKPKDGQYHLNAYADHVLGFIETMKLERPILVGNSMGGRRGATDRASTSGESGWFGPVWTRRLWTWDAKSRETRSRAELPRTHPWRIPCEA